LYTGEVVESEIFPFVRFLIFFLICLLFAGPHIFRVPSPPIVVPVSESVSPPGFFDRAEDRINRGMKRNLPDFVYAGAPQLLSFFKGTLQEVYGWSRTVDADPEADFWDRHGASAALWVFSHPWISGLLALLLVFRGRRWVVRPLRRVLLGRR
jgi:hypothetical protein